MIVFVLQRTGTNKCPCGSGRTTHWLVRQRNRVKPELVSRHCTKHVLAQAGAGDIAIHGLKRSLAIALVDAEGEDPVLNNGSAERAAELIEGHAGFVCQQLVSGVEVLGAEVLEDATVQIVGAGFANEVEISAHGSRVLSGNDTLGNLYFADRLDADAVDVVIVPEHRERRPLGIARGVGAIDGNTGSPATRAVKIDVAASACYTTRQRDDVSNVPAREG